MLVPGQGLLELAIRGRGAFRRFKDVLAAYPRERERWFAFHDARLRELVLRWLESHSDAPTMIGLDDLHWADPDSLGLLSFLARRIKPLPVALIATLRPWPPNAFGVAATLAHDGHAEMVTLSPLSELASGFLLAELVGRKLTSDVVSQAWQFCSGNPLLLQQVGLIDLTTSMPGGFAPVAVAVSPDGSHVYTANHSTSNVSVIDPGMKLVVAVITAALGPV